MKRIVRRKAQSPVTVSPRPSPCDGGRTMAGRFAALSGADRQKQENIGSAISRGMNQAHMDDGIAGQLSCASRSKII
jgi:hypothetical protein